MLAALISLTLRAANPDAADRAVPPQDQGAAAASASPGVAASAASLPQVLDEFRQAFDQGRPDQAQILARGLLAAAGSRESAKRTGSALLGIALAQNGRYAEAEPLLRRTTDFPELDRSRNAWLTLTGLMALGDALFAQGQTEQAEGVYREAVTKLPARPEQALRLRALSSHAMALVALERLSEAEPLLVSALHDSAGANDRTLGYYAAKASYLHARILNADARHGEAAEKAGAAARFWEAHGDDAAGQDLALALIELGKARGALGLGGEARAALERAGGLAEKHLGADHPQTAAGLLALANTLAKDGGANEAEALYRRSVAAAQRSGEPRLIVECASTFARALAKQKRERESMEYFRIAFAAIDRLLTHGQIPDESLRTKLMAEYDLLYAIGLQALLRYHRSSPGSGIGRDALTIAAQARNLFFAQLLRRANLKPYSPDPAFAQALAQRQALVARLDGLYRSWTLPGVLPCCHGPTPGDPSTRDNRRREIAARITSVDSALAELDKRLRAQFPRYMDLTQPAAVTVEELQRSVLQQGEILLNYFSMDNATLIFLVSRDQFFFYTSGHLPGEPAELVRSIRQTHREAQGSLAALTKLDPDELHRLYQILVQPVADRLVPGAKITVVADGALHLLPLEMLVRQYDVAERERFLAERAKQRIRLSEYATLDYLGLKHSFAYLPSLSALRSQRQHAAPQAQYTRELAAFIDPIFALEAGAAGEYSSATRSMLRALAPKDQAAAPLTLARLGRPAEEARAIARILGSKDSLFDRTHAQEYALKTLDLKTTRYLHLASYYSPLRGDALEIARPSLEASTVVEAAGKRNLAIAAAPSPVGGAAAAPAAALYQSSIILSLLGDLHGEDGFLTMGEIIENLNLGAELITLPAGGIASENFDAVEGEGLAALARAFLYAGARGLLVGLWQVESTPEEALAVEIFRQLKQGAKPASALEKARTRLRASASAAGGISVSHAHPYFWAPIVLMGD